MASKASSIYSPTITFSLFHTMLACDEWHLFLQKPQPFNDNCMLVYNKRKEKVKGLIFSFSTTENCSAVDFLPRLKSQFFQPLNLPPSCQGKTMQKTEGGGKEQFKIRLFVKLRENIQTGVQTNLQLRIQFQSLSCSTSNYFIFLSQYFIRKRAI